MPTDDEEGTDYINANYIPVRTKQYFHPLKFKFQHTFFLVAWHWNH